MAGLRLSVRCGAPFPVGPVPVGRHSPPVSANVDNLGFLSLVAVFNRGLEWKLISIPSLTSHPSDRIMSPNFSEAVDLLMKGVSVSVCLMFLRWGYDCDPSAFVAFLVVGHT